MDNQEQFKPKGNKLVLLLIIVAILLVTLSIFYYWFNRLDESNLMNLQDNIINNSMFHEDITNIIFERSSKPPLQASGKKVYNYEMVINYSNESEELNEIIAVIFLEEIFDFLKSDKTVIDCGRNQFCKVNDITLTKYHGDRTDTYSINNIDTKKSFVNQNIEYSGNKSGEYETITVQWHRLIGQNSEVVSPSSLFEIVDREGTKERDYIYTKAAIKNISNDTYSSIKVKVTHYDANMNVIDTDWTYAVGSEGLRPSEQKQFQIMTRMRNRDDYQRFKLEVIDFN